MHLLECHRNHKACLHDDRLSRLIISCRANRQASTHAQLRELRQARSSNFFALNDFYQAEQRRLGLESVIEKGLLHKILRFLNLGDVCHFDHPAHKSVDYDTDIALLHPSSARGTGLHMQVLQQTYQ